MDLAPDATATAIVPVLSCVLNQLCTRNDKLPTNQKGISKFHALRPPAISIKDYLTRIAKYASCSGECFVLALVYIDRVIQRTNFTLFVATDTYRQYYTELCNHVANGSCSCSTTKAFSDSLHSPSSTLSAVSSPTAVSSTLGDLPSSHHMVMTSSPAFSSASASAFSSDAVQPPTRRRKSSGTAAVTSSGAALSSLSAVLNPTSVSRLSSAAPAFTPSSVASQQPKPKPSRTSKTPRKSGGMMDDDMVDSPQIGAASAEDADVAVVDADADSSSSSAFSPSAVSKAMKVPSSGPQPAPASQSQSFPKRLSRTQTDGGAFIPTHGPQGGNPAGPIPAFTRQHSAPAFVSGGPAPVAAFPGPSFATAANVFAHQPTFGGPQPQGFPASAPTTNGFPYYTPFFDVHGGGSALAFNASVPFAPGMFAPSATRGDTRGTRSGSINGVPPSMMNSGRVPTNVGPGNQGAQFGMQIPQVNSRRRSHRLSSSAMISGSPVEFTTGSPPVEAM